MNAESTHSLISQLWGLVDDAPLAADAVRVTGSAALPSAFDVTGFATAVVAVATTAVARLIEAGGGGAAPGVTVDRREASAAFVCEALFEPEGWERPPIWDPIAGDYECPDSWIRLHTNYAHHRDAVERVLGPVATRDDVTAALANWTGADLETAVVQAGGCAAVMRDRTYWQASPAGIAAYSRPPLEITDLGDAADSIAQRPAGFDPGRPLAGVRVLDLTRVIAGPVTTRFLAAYGADVLRVDSPTFSEVPALVPETSAGKRCTALDLRDPDDRRRFEALLRDADVLVSGLRDGALDQLGYDAAVLRDMNAGLIDARLNAYGWSGPWRRRRGFDSLVQMSCGIAAAGAEAAGQTAPRPLPAQALDHGTGYLLAAAIVAALSRRTTTGQTCSLLASLAGTATIVMNRPTPGGLSIPGPDWSRTDTQAAHTSWGPARSVPIPGHITATPSYLGEQAGPLGRHPPAWAPR